MTKTKRCPARGMGTVWLKEQVCALGFGCGNFFDSGLQLRSGAAGAGAAVALGKLIHTTSGIDEALFTREKRMAGRANADAQIGNGGDGVINDSASAGDRRFVCLRMDIFAHGIWSPRYTARCLTVLSPGRGRADGTGDCHSVKPVSLGVAPPDGPFPARHAAPGKPHATR